MGSCRRKMMTTISIDQEGAFETNTSFDLIVGLCNFGLCHVVDDIINYLDTRSLCRFEIVCKSWRLIVEDDRHWKKKIPQDEVLSNGVDPHITGYLKGSKYKLAVAEQYLLDQAWDNRDPKEKKICFDSFVLSLCQDQGTSVYVGLNNGSILETMPVEPFEIVRHIDGAHNKGVKCLEMWTRRETNVTRRRLLVSGCYDGTIKVWDLPNMSCLFSVHHHSDAVWCVKASGRHLASNGMDGKVVVLECF